jgi:YVTN family beta-propeller protein
MLRRTALCLGITLAALILAARPIPAEPRTAPRQQYKSPLGLAVDEKGERAYVALPTAGSVGVVDLRAGKVLREIAVDENPSYVVLDGDNVHVRCDGRGEVITIDLAREVIIQRVPRAEALKGVRSYLFELWEYPSAGLVDFAPAGSSNLRGMVERLGKRFLVHQRPKANVSSTQVAQGWVFTNVIDQPSGLGGLYNPYLLAPLDEPQRGYADPGGIVVTPDGERLFVCCGGADTVLALDRARLQKYLDELPRGPAVYEAGVAGGNDLTASRKYVIAHIPTQANPRRLALSGDGKTLVVSNHLADSLTVIDTATLKVVRTLSLSGPEPDPARRGEILFNSGKMTFQGQFTCASCHPDGGADGLNWDLTRDGVGNFKNTKSLLGVKETAPYGWHGSSPTLADRVAGTLRTLHRHEPAGTEVDDLVAYLETLPPPRPLPPKDADKPAIARGRELFQGKAQCSACHHRAGLDDGKQHDVGTRGPTDTQDNFDTPALWGVARTAPYLHDGRAATLEEVFTKYDAAHRHGAAHTLGKDELADLIVYLKSL